MSTKFPGRSRVPPLHPPAQSSTSSAAPCIFISPLGYRQQQRGQGWKQDTSAPAAPGRPQGARSAPLHVPLRAAPLWGLELLNQRLLSVSHSLVSPLGVHGFGRGEMEQPTDNGPTRGGGSGSRKLGRFLPPSLPLVALAVCKGLPSHMDPAHPAAAPGALTHTPSRVPAPV